MLAACSDVTPRYAGGNTHIHISVGDVTEYKFPKDGSEPQKRLYMDRYDDMNGDAFPINDKYYMLIDRAGIFLRSYDGLKDEITVYVFKS